MNHNWGEDLKPSDLPVRSERVPDKGSPAHLPSAYGVRGSLRFECCVSVPVLCRQSSCSVVEENKGSKVPGCLLLFLSTCSANSKLIRTCPLPDEGP